MYKIEVIPNDEYLNNASYPVVIDPEIRIIDGGLIDGAFSVTTVDLLDDTTIHHSIGSFTVNNRINSNPNDDIKAYFNILIPQYYNTSLVNALLNNQFMYSYVTLPTVSVNRYSDTTVNLKYNGEVVASDIFHNMNVFDHKFDVYNVINSKIDDLASGDLYFTFELTIDGSDSFSIPADYAGVFKSFSVTLRNIKGYLATSSTCVSIGGGWHSRRYAVSAAVSYYWLINSSYSTLGSIMDRVRSNSNKYL